MGLLLIILITALFFLRAKKNNLNKYMWSFIGFISFFIGIIVCALILVIIDPDIPTKEISSTTLWIATAAGLFNSGIAWFMMSSRIKENQ